MYRREEGNTITVNGMGQCEKMLTGDSFRYERGFTLVEIIVAIVVASIIGAMFVQYMGTSLFESVRPVIGVQERLTIDQVMENMTVDYKKLLSESETPLQTFKGNVENGNVSGNDPYYGPYTLDYNDYVTFDGNGNESTGGDRILKVTVSSHEQRLTTLFTK